MPWWVFCRLLGTWFVRQDALYPASTFLTPSSCELHPTVSDVGRCFRGESNELVGGLELGIENWDPGLECQERGREVRASGFRYLWNLEKRERGEIRLKEGHSFATSGLSYARYHNDCR